ncbi:MAG: hypothetical protein QOH72_5544 [Solirubrobacteraceae bacterium]|jgi:hypothetical protein|nr:hypothetical protein [Solirubrobacteraceae bacterium]
MYPSVTYNDGWTAFGNLYDGNNMLVGHWAYDPDNGLVVGG